MVCNRMFLVVVLLVYSAIPLNAESSVLPDASTLDTTTDGIVSTIKDLQNDSPASSTAESIVQPAAQSTVQPTIQTTVQAIGASSEDSTSNMPTRRPSMSSTSPPLEHTTAAEENSHKNSGNFYKSSLAFLLVTLLPFVTIY